jgi:serine/threonine-protein kinase
MSPEQMRSSRDVDHRSDIWALGVVLYELLQGVPPFGGDTFSSMVIKVVSDPLPQLTVQLPGDLAAIVYRCLEKDPARRFQNVAELAHALAPYAQSETQATISVQRTRSIIGLEAQRSATEPGAARRALPPSTLSGAAGSRTTSKGGRRWPIVAGLGVLASAIAVALVASTGGGSDSGKKADGPAPAARPEIAAPAAVTPPPPPPAAVTPPPPPPAAVTPPPPTTPQPVAAPSAPPAGASPGSAATPPPDTMAKKAKKPAKPAAGSNSNSSTAKPKASPEEDVLGTRN